MTGNKFTVGLHLKGARHSVTVTAEDALMAALKMKLEPPTAAVNFVRRGDLRHPHEAVAELTARSRCSGVEREERPQPERT